MELELERELRFHLDQQIADLIARGVEPAEAGRLARLSMGGMEQVKEACRDARGTRWIEDFWQDLRYTLRTLGQRRGFAAVALLTLGLGIAATTLMFTVVNGVLLKPLPYHDPDRLLWLQEKTDWSTHWGNLWAFSYPNYVDCRKLAGSLDTAAWRFINGTVSSPGDPENVEGREISARLFDVLGIRMFAGREFRPDEDQPGGPPVAIIGYGMWQRRFEGSPAAIGAHIVFQQKPYTVVGIAPPGFRLLGSAFELFTPLGQDAARYMQERDGHGLRVIGRLRAGVTLAHARMELERAGRDLERQYPKSNKGRIFVGDPLLPPVEDVQGTLWLLLGAVTLVLLIACANIASLLLARAVSREREIAMRLALGASRGRLARQCLTESSVLAVAGGGLGVAVAVFGLQPFLTLWPGSLPRVEEVGVDWRVLAFALAVSLLSGLLFGLAPALRVPIGALENSLRSGPRTIGTDSRRLHGVFVSSEIALAVVLLVSAGTLGRTLLHLASLDPGIDVHNVLTARTALAPITLADPERTRAAWRDILDRVRSVPGVEHAAIVDTVPLREGNNEIGYRTSAAELPPERQPLVSATCVTPDYLGVMRLRLRQGRFFTDQDGTDSESVALIDDVMAREAFGGDNPIGRYVWIDLGVDPRRVVGVVGHVRYWGASDDDKSQVRAQLYYPLAQVPNTLMRRWSELMSIAVRTGVRPLGIVDPVKRAVRGAGTDQVIYEVNTMEDLAQSAVALQRFLMMLFGIFAGLALVLASVGIFGVLAYITSRRIPEFGVRVALGATPRDIGRLVFRRTFLMVGSGLLVGVLAAAASVRLLERLVAGIPPAEPGTFAVMIAVLIAAASIASFLPARHAARVEPLNALRTE